MTADRRISELVSLRTPWAIRVAVTLEIPQLLADPSADRSTAAIAAATGTLELPLAELLGVLRKVDLVAVDSDGRWRLTELGRALLESDEFDELHLDSMQAHLDHAWAGLLHTVRTGRSGYEAVFGRSLWDATDADPHVAASFDEYIAEWAATWSPAIAASRVWPDHGVLADVGGGSGQLLAAVLAARPGLRGVLVELPNVTDRAGAVFAATGVADRAATAPGSFFGPLPTADHYVLAQVLHDWPDDDALRILEGCATAAADGAHLTIVERLTDAADHNDTMTLFMLLVFGGRERASEQFVELAASAGWVHVATEPGAFGLHLLTFRRRN